MSDEPIGWKAYRTNLLLLYETLQPSGGDAVIDRLGEEAAQLAKAKAPDFAEMWGKLNEIEARLFLKLDDTRLREQTERKLVQAQLMELPGVAGVRERFEAVTGDDATATRNAAPWRWRCWKTCSCAIPIATRNAPSGPKSRCG